ncbi:hypothetical protein PHYPO_G00188130 [Pangasianodon hypophthalmus]|uniref:HIG1 domain-containing protein n=1 Tax=Pangasianodon hypophthalmus TaxID=310915 RepID=A0A5N5PHD5_PANHP|nr:hypothetical protein PHYPO_G00188130 [Pangasianodon hypophthalmus]
MSTTLSVSQGDKFISWGGTVAQRESWSQELLSGGEISQKSSTKMSIVSFDENEESKFLRKAKENPFVPVGMAGFFAIVAHRLYKMKHRGSMKMSVHLIHIVWRYEGRGVVYSMYRDFILKRLKLRSWN